MNFTTYKRHKLQQESHNPNKEASNKTYKQIDQIGYTDFFMIALKTFPCNCDVSFMIYHSLFIIYENLNNILFWIAPVNHLTNFRIA